MKLKLCLLSVALLSGCAEMQRQEEERRLEYAKSLDFQCQTMGYRNRDEAHKNCILMLHKQRQMERQRANDAQMGMAMQLLNNSGPRTLAPSQVVCNSVDTGSGTYRTTCQ